MTPDGERLLALLAERMVHDHGLRDEIGPLEGLTWEDEPGAIVSEGRHRIVRVDRDAITLTTKRFAASKRIPLS